jgi:hypothetical protein
MKKGRAFKERRNDERKVGHLKKEGMMKERSGI